MADLQKIAKMHDHLSHLADKLSALSSLTYVLDKHIVKNDTIDSFIFRSEEAICQAIDILNEARDDLNKDLSDDELQKLNSLL